jgi:hypothetical protein
LGELALVLLLLLLLVLAPDEHDLYVLSGASPLRSDDAETGGGAAGEGA